MKTTVFTMSMADINHALSALAMTPAQLEARIFKALRERGATEVELVRYDRDMTIEVRATFDGGAQLVGPLFAKAGDRWVVGGWLREPLALVRQS